MKNTVKPGNAPSLCIISPSASSRISESTLIRLSDLIEMIKPSVEKVFLIANLDSMQDYPEQENVYFTGNAQCPDAGSPILSMIIGELRAQLQITRCLRSLPDEASIILWRGRSSTFVIPLVVARLTGKKSILFIESKGSELVNEVYDRPFGFKSTILSKIYHLIESINYFMADKLVVNVPSLLEQTWLTKYGKKVFPSPTAMRFIDYKFEVIRPWQQRQPIIAYIGRMNQEKGVSNLARAISQIYKQIKNICFMLVGEGPLLPQIEDELADLIPNGYVRLSGWIPHNRLPDYLNDIKLLVLPSAYEGLPTIVLEAMACGTPVLATPVGAVPDIIIDGETGFLMEDNSPECIEKNITRALNNPNIEQISHNGKEFVERNYRYTVLKERYRELITGLSS